MTATVVSETTLLVSDLPLYTVGSGSSFDPLSGVTMDIDHTVYVHVWLCVELREYTYMAMG